MIRLLPPLASLLGAAGRVLSQPRPGEPGPRIGAPIPLLAGTDQNGASRDDLALARVLVPFAFTGLYAIYGGWLLRRTARRAEPIR